MVEVMVVMVIMGIAFASMLSAVSGVRESARSAACRSNLRQSHIAIIGFSDTRPGGQLPTAEPDQSVIGMRPPPLVTEAMYSAFGRRS